MRAWTSTPSSSFTASASRTSSSWPSRRALGPLEHAIGNSLRPAEDLRLPTTFADVSNLDGNNKPFARDDRRRLFAIGNRLWHSDCSFKVDPGEILAAARAAIPSKGGNTEFAHMGAAYEALDEETKELIEPLVCEHSQMFSRAKLGFTEFTPEERERFKPVRQRLVRVHPEHRAQVDLPVVARRHDPRLAGLPEARRS